ncbi:histidinol-phosphatase [Moniliophthora roreri MCA 2997]|uniref:Histidinol-phosphatase n=2 Tax=Moniliophthora roreri TaxID=221103 RepID=V2X0W1_MONRO|nr:histidinol-phosphatase [Moniliophthora roreri MCA 2997]KAI3616826.1 histidinol-phosphatase [Moniliophthora roreri]
MPYSHHSHSGQFCKHASGTLEEVVLEAIRQGFEVYGLTEHVPRYRSQDLYPEEEGLDSGALLDQFDRFIHEAHRLKTLYASQITLLVGLETEFITSADLHHLDDLLRRYEGRVEYLVGSVHHVGEIPIDFDAPTYYKCLRAHEAGTETETMENFLCSYFDAQYTLLERFRPEIIGHIDLCRLYRPSLRLEDYRRAWASLERNIRFGVEYGALFEVNSAALRKNWDTAYPGQDVLRLIVSQNGKLTLSDDSHGPHAVGLNYKRMAQYLESQGITDVWFLQRTDLPTITGRFVQPVKAPPGWNQHVFWNGKN